MIRNVICVNNHVKRETDKSKILFRTVLKARLATGKGRKDCNTFEAYRSGAP